MDNRQIRWMLGIILQLQAELELHRRKKGHLQRKRSHLLLYLLPNTRETSLIGNFSSSLSPLPYPTLPYPTATSSSPMYCAAAAPSSSFTMTSSTIYWRPSRRANTNTAGPRRYNMVHPRPQQVQAGTTRETASSPQSTSHPPASSIAIINPNESAQCHAIGTMNPNKHGLQLIQG